MRREGGVRSEGSHRVGGWLSWILVVGAAMSLVLSSCFLVFLVPPAKRHAVSAGAVQNGMSQLQYLLSGEVNDERGFLLTGDPSFVVQFADKQQRFEVQLESVLAHGSRPVRDAIDTAVESYRSFLVDHATVIALWNSGDRTGAMTLAFGSGREFRKTAEEGFAIAGGEAAKESSDANSREASLNFVAGMALIVLGVGLLFVAWVTVRRLRTQHEEEAALRASERLHRALVDHAPVAVYAVDLDGVVEAWNPAATTMFGWTEAQAVGMGLPFVSADRADEFARLRAEAAAGRHLVGFEAVRSRRDGSEIDVAISTAAVFDDSGHVVGIIGIAVDITERKHAEIELASHRRYEQQLASIVTASADAILSTSLDGTVMSWNAGAETMFGYLSADVMGQPFEILAPPHGRAEHNYLIARALAGHSTIGKEVIAVRNRGVEFPAAITTSPVLDADHRVIGVSGVVRDITAQKALEATLVRRTLHDDLTGLPNRVLFLDRLALALHRLGVHGGVVGVVFIDIDQFKVVNDSLGHPEGDRLLMMVAERLRAAVRRSDTVARFGGDEFAVLCEDVHDDTEALAAAERIQQAGSAPFVLDGRDYYVTLSAGIALTHSAEASPADLLRDADAAMYQAKDAGRSCSVVFAESMRTRAVRRLDVELSLRRAIIEGDLRLAYQPIVNLRTGRIDGVEALVRWQHPTDGLVMPAEFIPVAEQTGLIIPLGEWVLGEACRQVRAWHTNPRLDHLTVSVNLSGSQITQVDIVTVVANILDNTGLVPSRLVLEITESVLMRDAHKTMAVLNELKALGVGLSIDDFGTGYSSLSYLKKFPIDILKIDKSFVDGLIHDNDDASIVQATIDLAHSLRLTTIAEGTETMVQVQTLIDLGCDSAQGYLFSRPRFADELTAHLLNPIQRLPPH